MAKARKPKNDEAPGAKPSENSGAKVLHQKLCLSIDFKKRRIYGYTELEVSVPDIGIVGLHAENLVIESVLVDGEPTVFEYYPHHGNPEPESNWSSVSDPASAADAAAMDYVGVLKKEDTANLLINCCKPSSKDLSEQLFVTWLSVGATDSENRDVDVGWPGIMSIRVYELDGMSDHPKLPMAGDRWQLLELPCHSKLAAKRYQKPKKGGKPDGADENVDTVAPLDNKTSIESPLAWIKADPEMEYIAEVHLHQPLQMWVNQLEKDGDVVGQAQAIASLEALKQHSFSVVNALNNILTDSKVFWRIRIGAAFALAKTASEENDWAGLQHLIKFYKSRRFDAEIGLPKPNDFRDFPEYFVLEAIPHTIAMVRGADGKSPREAVEFILQLLKYNDNSGNPYSDVFWLAVLVQSIGDLDFGQQLLELPCHSKLAAKRYQKPKKGGKPDGADENVDAVAPLDNKTSIESPLAWIKADPEMEYIAEVHLHQPLQMWVNQLEKDGDVVGQAQAIASLEALKQHSFSVVNALNNILTDSKVFWRIRIGAAFALAKTASEVRYKWFSSDFNCLEENDWAGLQHLIKFYKSRRFDAEIGLPKPNDFRDFPEYFVLEAIPHTIAMVRGADGKSPREAVEFVLQLLKYNDNSGNPYSDVFWLAVLVQSIGDLEFGQQAIPHTIAMVRGADGKSPREAVEFVLQLLKYNDNSGNPYSDVFWLAVLVQSIGDLEFGQQSLTFLAPLLKRIDRLLQFDRLMPSYSGVLTISCIRTLAQTALKLSDSISFEYICKLLEPFRKPDTILQVRIEASRALLDIEYESKGISSALSLFMKYVVEESSLRGQVKLCVHTMRLCQIAVGCDSDDCVDTVSLLDLLHLFKSHVVFNNEFLRHHLFCIFQILAGSSVVLELKSFIYGRGVQGADGKSPREAVEFILQLLKYNDNSGNPYSDVFWLAVLVQSIGDLDFGQQSLTFLAPLLKRIDRLLQFDRLMPSYSGVLTISCIRTLAQTALKLSDSISFEYICKLLEPFRKPDTILQVRIEASRALLDIEYESKGISSALSLFMKYVVEESSLRGQVKLCVHTMRLCQIAVGCDSDDCVDTVSLLDLLHLFKSHVVFNNEFLRHHLFCIFQILAGSVKLPTEGDTSGKELQCTAESGKTSTSQKADNDNQEVAAPSLLPQDNNNMGNEAQQKYGSLQTLSVGKESEKKKDKEHKKEKKRKREDPVYLEKKRLKKEKKQKEKEMSKLLTSSSDPATIKIETIPEAKPEGPSDKPKAEPSAAPAEARPSTKIRIKLKSKAFNNP
ncbi:hypothetical protein F2Q68_00046405 [Brassica cretica]|uniref:Transcription initiation factor TFIID subunit 2 n=1 Tax=Brassica cretica TaxID=69181 RepID=A0A8S9LTD9_BRACR|nr:hypothetical protein F2Q68_00046405 [Brassica cretica]